jgi:hypothetical protein
VRVHDVHRRRAAGEQPVDDRVEVGREHLLTFRIPLRMREQERLPVVLAGEPLHVVIDENADRRVHRSRARERRCQSRRPRSGVAMSSRYGRAADASKQDRRREHRESSSRHGISTEGSAILRPRRVGNKTLGHG